MSQTSFTDDLYSPNVSCKTIRATSPCIGDSMILSDAAIAASKLVHRYHATHAQKAGTDVVSETMPVHTFRAAGSIVAVEIVPIVAPTGGNKLFTVDVKRGNAGAGFASILSAVITVDQASVSRTVYVAAITLPNAVDGDTLEVVIAASGSTGSQGQGVLVNVHVEEQPV